MLVGSSVAQSECDRLSGGTRRHVMGDYNSDNDNLTLVALLVRDINTNIKGGRFGQHESDESSWKKIVVSDCDAHNINVNNMMDVVGDSTTIMNNNSAGIKGSKGGGGDNNILEQLNGMSLNERRRGTAPRITLTESGAQTSAANGLLKMDDEDHQQQQQQQLSPRFLAVPRLQEIGKERRPPPPPTLMNSG